jgi:flagellar basal-body rod protein FlgF
MLDAINAAHIALLQDELRLQSISQNIANMQTPGYQRVVLESQSFGNTLNASLATVRNTVWQNLQSVQGVLSASARATDLAISGAGYFEVQTDEGVFYTRRGDFKVTASGTLETSSGATLLGDHGAVQVDGLNFTINSAGDVLLDGQKTQQIHLVQFANPQSLKPLGNGLYQSTESPISRTHESKILQGFLEQSNVKSTDEMMNMIQTSRHFEASQRILTTANHFLATAIHELGESNV